MIKDLADNLMTEGKQHVRVEIENRHLSRHADFIKDRLRYKTYLLTGVVPKAAPHAAGRRPSSTSSTKRRRDVTDVLAPAHAPAMVRVATSCDGAASRRPATSRDGLRWYAIVRDCAATPRISRDIPRYSAIFRDMLRWCDVLRWMDSAILCDKLRYSGIAQLCATSSDGSVCTYRSHSAQTWGGH